MRHFSFSVVGSCVILYLISTGCARVNHLASSEYQSYQITSSESPGTSVAGLESTIAPYRQHLAVEMDEVVGYCKEELTKSSGESTLGNWVADAVLGFAEEHLERDLDIAICNTGGLRISSLPMGPITKGMLFELMPFDNYLVLMELDGVILKKLFDHMAARRGWPISQGVTYVIKNDQAEEITINSQPLDLNKEYTLLLSDYVAQGGDSSDFLESIPGENLNIYYRDAMIGYAQMLTSRGEQITAEIEGRIKTE